ncbi:septum formation family protein [Dactylosporangium sp. CS-033363]|uniref:septum formation family protein n=1 Tax=Dactylosporangium sp. CS-033363 TaxID=3239935 RepID=UPI003D8A355D
MKRIALLAACAVALLLATAGCGPVKAGDGDLVDDWGMLAAAKVPEPEPGWCWLSTAVNARDLDTVAATRQACDSDHSLETITIGHFTGDAAKGANPPTGEAVAAAWGECVKAADDFLGGAWGTGRVYVMVNPPTSSQWNGGARFYRCDAAALRSEAGILDLRKTTLKGTVAASGELRLTCGASVGMTADSWDDITPASCTAAHDVEFVGTITSPAKDYPADGNAFTAAFDGLCESQLLAYTGMTKSTYGTQRSLSYGYWQTGGKTEWAAGNHTARCYAVIDGKKISKSIKGIGNVQV